MLLRPRRRTMAGMSEARGDDLGRRIAAARAYRSMSVQVLADELGIKAPTVERVELGTETMTDDEAWALLENVARVTDLPTQFFTVDFEQLPSAGSPSTQLGKLMERMELVLSRGDRQIIDGRGLIEAFLEHSRRNEKRDADDSGLIRRIAAHLGIH